MALILFWLPELATEQEVEVAFGLMGIIEDCDAGTLTRRIDADQVVRVVSSPRGNLKPPTAAIAGRVHPAVGGPRPKREGDSGWRT